MTVQEEPFQRSANGVVVVEDCPPTAMQDVWVGQETLAKLADTKPVGGLSVLGDHVEPFHWSK